MGRSIQKIDTIGNSPGQKYFCKRLIHRLYGTFSSLLTQSKLTVDESSCLRVMPAGSESPIPSAANVNTSVCCVFFFLCIIRFLVP